MSAAWRQENVSSLLPAPVGQLPALAELALFLLERWRPVCQERSLALPADAASDWAAGSSVGS
jgi:hypothetical protein